MISLALSSYCPKMEWLINALDSAQGFDEIVLYCRGGRDRFAENLSMEERENGIVVDFEGHERNSEILKKYCMDHPKKNIKLFIDTVPRFGNKGMQYAIEKAKGDWILPFSDDDKLITRHLLEAIKQIKDGNFNDFDVLFSQAVVNGCETWGTTNSNFSLEALKENNLVPFSSFIKKESYYKAGGYLENDPIADWGLWIRMKTLGMKFKYFDLPIYDYRYCSQSTMNIINSKYGSFGNIKSILLKNAERFVNENA